MQCVVRVVWVDYIIIIIDHLYSIFSHRILCLIVKFRVSHTITVVSSEPVMRYGDLGGTIMQVTGPLCPGIREGESDMEFTLAS